MSKLLPTNGFIWIDPKEFELNKYTINSLTQSWGEKGVPPL